MKKLAAFVTILSIAISSTIIPCFASEEVVISEETRDFWEDVIDELDEDEYGGAYIKDGILHIKPQDKVQTQSVLFDVAPNARMASDIILDDEAKYTISELKSAMKKANDLWETFNLNYVALSEEYNGLLVGAYKWTEEQKEEFVKIIGIENVIFDTVNAYEMEEKVETTQKNQEENLERAFKQQLPGNLIYNDNVKENGVQQRSTLTACVLGDIDGYITTAHKGVENGHQFKYDDETSKSQKILGTVSDRIVDGSRGVDAAIIKRDPSAIRSNVLRNEITKKVGNQIFIEEPRRYLMTEEVAIEGDKVKIFGGQDIKAKEAYIQSTHCTKKWDTKDDYGDDMWYNIIMMTIVGDLYTTGGDSGSPVTIKLYDDKEEYGIVGVYKGADITACGRSFYSDDMAGEEDICALANEKRPFAFASNWFNVKRAFGIDSIY